MGRTVVADPIGVDPVGGRRSVDRRRRLHRRLLAALGVLLATSGCEAALEPVEGRWLRGVITSEADPNQFYRHDTDGDVLVITAPSAERSGALREILIRDGTPSSLDQESCVTWHGPADGTAIQPGIMLRVRSEGDRILAIMITDNVMHGYRSAINISLVDTDAEPPYQLLGQRYLKTIGADTTEHPLPWRFCGQVSGGTVRAKAWSTTRPEPSWSDPGAVFTMAVPESHRRPGRPGIYMGHLGSGLSTRLSDHTTRQRGEPSEAVRASMRRLRAALPRPAFPARRS